MVLVTDAGATGPTVMASFFKAAANDGKRTTVVLRPITVDPGLAVDVVPDVRAQLDEVPPEEVLPGEAFPDEVLLLAVGLLVELPLQAAAKSATAAIAPSAGSRRKLLLDAALVIKKSIPTPSWPAAFGPHAAYQPEGSARRARQRQSLAYSNERRSDRAAGTSICDLRSTFGLPLDIAERAP